MPDADGGILNGRITGREGVRYEQIVENSRCRVPIDQRDVVQLSAAASDLARPSLPYVLSAALFLEWAAPRPTASSSSPRRTADFYRHLAEGG
jgi:hypothetical protein